MNLETISYHDLFTKNTDSIIHKIKFSLSEKGIIGITDVPKLPEFSNQYITAVREFSRLSDAIKNKYAPNRDAGETEGYELGAEWFKNKNGEWQVDDKKASYYAFVPNNKKNKWPLEIDLQTPYLQLGQLIFNVGKKILKFLSTHEDIILNCEQLTGYGRMLHYHKENDLTNENPDWCGAHFDHGVFTGLIPARYFYNEQEIAEPAEAGLYIMRSNSNKFEKINIEQNSLIFQVGEFGQLIFNDQIRATKHYVRKSLGNIDRYTFALFYSAPNQIIKSTSCLTKDPRYINNQINGTINYNAWENASYAQYRASLDKERVTA